MKTARLKAFVAFLAIVALCAAPATAYRMIQNTSTGRVTAGTPVACSDSGGFTHWSYAVTSWYHNLANQGAGKSAALYNAMNVWTFVTSASHVPAFVGFTSAGFSTDGVNAVSWDTGQGCSGSCLALTALVLQSGQEIIESDITFNNAYTWTTNGSDYDTWSVAAHEFGHALGIHHTEVTTSPTPTMDAFYFGSGARTLETDDQSALQCSQSNYPPSTSCIPDGGVDDTLSNTSCCSGIAVQGSTHCLNPSDYGTTWASCYQICASVSTGNCASSGGVDDTLGLTSCCSGSAVTGSTRCLDPTDYANGWASCIHTCL